MTGKRKDIIPVDIKREIHAKISQLAENQNKSIRQYVNDVLAGHIIISNYLYKKAHEISRIGANEEGIFMKDKGKSEIATITLKKGVPFCSMCKNDLCIHIIVSFAQPTDYIKLLENVKE